MSNKFTSLFQIENCSLLKSYNVIMSLGFGVMNKSTTLHRFSQQSRDRGCDDDVEKVTNFLNVEIHKYKFKSFRLLGCETVLIEICL